MNDYAKGALEALAWMDSLLSKAEPKDVNDPQAAEAWDLVRREVLGARNELLQGVAVDFRDRLRASWAFK